MYLSVWKDTVCVCPSVRPGSNGVWRLCVCICVCMYVCMYVRPSPFELNSSISYPLCLSHPILPI